MAFPTTPVIETFTGDNDTAPPNANWSNIYNGVEIQSNEVVAILNNNINVGIWNTETFGPDCEVYITMVTKPSNNDEVAVIARGTTLSISTFDGYMMQTQTLSASDRFTHLRLDNGAGTQLGATFDQEMSDGDSIGLEIIGDTNELQAYYKPAAGSWGTAGTTRDDGTYTAAGYIGIMLVDTGSSADNFGGGDIVVGGGGLVIPVAMHHYTKNIGSR